MQIKNVRTYLERLLHEAHSPILELRYVFSGWIKSDRYSTRLRRIWDRGTLDFVVGNVLSELLSDSGMSVESVVSVEAGSCAVICREGGRVDGAAGSPSGNPQTPSPALPFAPPF